ncbi:MAG: hypothetical protein ACYSWP_12850 [Planctomycetota bacterium]|jgi:hypothetical protein
MDETIDFLIRVSTRCQELRDHFDEDNQINKLLNALSGDAWAIEQEVRRYRLEHSERTF